MVAGFGRRTLALLASERVGVVAWGMLGFHATAGYSATAGYNTRHHKGIATRTLMGYAA